MSCTVLFYFVDKIPAITIKSIVHHKVSGKYQMLSLQRVKHGTRPIQLGASVESLRDC